MAIICKAYFKIFLYNLFSKKHYFILFHITN